MGSEGVPAVMLEQATRRGPQWAPDPRPSRLRPWLYGLAWLVIIVASGVRW